MGTKWFLLASGNPHKSEEFNKLFNQDLLRVKSAPGKIEVDETGNTFVENAFLKAEAYYKKFKMPVLSDDSGLVVSSLPDELGVKSARFGGSGLDDAGRCSLLLQKMEQAKDRSAYFVCVLCFYLSSEEIFFFEGRCSGRISDNIEGSGGFGYDPVFIPEGQNLSFAEDLGWKSKNGHRGKAVAEAQRFFESF